jgi:hypothetical protein
MTHRITRSVFSALLLALAVLMALPGSSFGQTFRGGINGSVTDQSGAVVPGAQVDAVDSATGVSHKTISSSAGEFAFQDLPLGTYEVEVSASGFQAAKVEQVPVTAGSIYTLPIKLGIAKAAVTVEVDAAAITLDTTSTTQTAEVGGVALQDTPLNGRDFTQLIILSPGFSNSGAGGYGSLNGTRANRSTGRSTASTTTTCGTTFRRSTRVAFRASRASSFPSMRSTSFPPRPRHRPNPGAIRVAA